MNARWFLNGEREPFIEKGKVEVDPEDISIVQEPKMANGKANELEQLKKEVERLKIENAAYLKAFEAMGKVAKPVESANRNVA